MEANIEIYEKTLENQQNQWFLKIWGVPGASRRGGGILGRLGGVLGRLVGVLGRSWGVLEASWRRLRPILEDRGTISMVKMATRRHQDSPETTPETPRDGPKAPEDPQGRNRPGRGNPMEGDRGVFPPSLLDYETFR